jgi:hypothetical protein
MIYKWTKIAALSAREEGVSNESHNMKADRLWLPKSVTSNQEL